MQFICHRITKNGFKIYLKVFCYLPCRNTLPLNLNHYAMLLISQWCLYYFLLLSVNLSTSVYVYTVCPIYLGLQKFLKYLLIRMYRGKTLTVTMFSFITALEMYISKVYELMSQKGQKWCSKGQVILTLSFRLGPRSWSMNAGYSNPHNALR